SILSRTSLSNIIQQPNLDLYKRDRARMPLEDVIENMRHDIGIQIDPTHSVAGRSLAFHVQFIYRDRVKAQATVQALITRFVDSNLILQQDRQSKAVYDDVDRLEARIAVLEKRLGISNQQPATAHATFIRRDGEALAVLDPPSLPMKPATPNRAAF